MAESSWLVACAPTREVLPVFEPSTVHLPCYAVHIDGHLHHGGETCFSSLCSLTTKPARVECGATLLHVLSMAVERVQRIFDTGFYALPNDHPSIKLKFD